MIINQVATCLIAGFFFFIVDTSGRDNRLEIYHIGYIFRTG